MAAARNSEASANGESPPGRYVALCRAVGDAVRLDVLRVLRHESLGVLELCRIFDVPQPRMSHHLKILLNAGLVRTRREGTNVFYRRAIASSEDPVHDLHAALMAAVQQPRHSQRELGPARRRAGTSTRRGTQGAWAPVKGVFH